MSNAGLVEIDKMAPGPFPTSPSFLNASGVGINNVVRTLTPIGITGFSASGHANIALKDSETATLTYSFASPLTVADFSVPSNANWLMQLEVGSLDLSTFTVEGFVNNTSYGSLGPLTGTGGLINADFLGAISGDINSLSFVFTHLGPSFDIITVHSVSAVPEPTSVLTAGAFSLACGWVYRRRKTKKLEALTV